MSLDIDSWMSELIEKLKETFGSRLLFVGLQGSRARGEERETSDIDSVVVIDGLDAPDIDRYRSIIQSMPEAQLACGFIGSPQVLASWPRYDVFNLVMDTKPLFGSLDFMSTDFDRADARLSAKAGASEIYHALAHTLAFDPHSLPQVVESCLKSAFFVMRSMRFADAGEYPASRAQMKAIASPEERTFLDAYDSAVLVDSQEMASSLLSWASIVLATE